MGGSDDGSHATHLGRCRLAVVPQHAMDKVQAKELLLNLLLRIHTHAERDVLLSEGGGCGVEVKASHHLLDGGFHVREHGVLLARVGSHNLRKRVVWRLRGVTQARGSGKGRFSQLA